MWRTFKKCNYYLRLPIFIPKGSFAKLLVNYYHELVQHNGLKETLNEIRTSYWIPKARYFINQIIQKCRTCKRIEGKTYIYPEPPSLPAARLSESPPFTFTGLGYAGPVPEIYIIILPIRTCKAWIIILPIRTYKACIIILPIRTYIAMDNYSTNTYVQSMDNYSTNTYVQSMDNYSTNTYVQSMDNYSTNTYVQSMDNYSTNTYVQSMDNYSTNTYVQSMHNYSTNTYVQSMDNYSTNTYVQSMHNYSTTLFHTTCCLSGFSVWLLSSGMY